MTIHRRRFLQLGAAGLALSPSIPFLRNPMFRRALEAADCDLSPAKKMLVIWQRGGNDGVNTIIPFGDSTYNPTTRPTLFIDAPDRIDLNGYCALHPALWKLQEVLAAEDLAIVHRVGYPSQSRSHFRSQNIWENALPTNSELPVGWVNNLISADATLDASPFPAASVSNQQQLLFQGPKVLSHINDLTEYSLGSSPADLKLIGALPGAGTDGTGLLGIYSDPATGAFYDAMIRDTGNAMTAGLDHLICRQVDPDSYVPYGGATYPSNSAPEEFSGGTSFNFFRQLKQAVQLLKETDVRVVGVEIGGWDLHSNQGGVTGNHADRLNNVAHGIRSAFRDLQDPMADIWNDTVILTNTEFGRTSLENNSVGTDHAEASVVLVAGGAVSGGLWNCDATTWSDGDLLSIDGNYLSHQTDFRAIFAEIASNHFGLGASLDSIIPGWSGLGLSFPGIV
ncbi:MAG: DUF1501 domain-containing protein [Planctomycetota bacterium]